MGVSVFGRCPFEMSSMSKGGGEVNLGWLTKKLQCKQLQWKYFTVDCTPQKFKQTLIISFFFFKGIASFLNLGLTCRAIITLISPKSFFWSKKLPAGMKRKCHLTSALRRAFRSPHRLGTACRWLGRRLQLGVCQECGRGMCSAGERQ